MDEYKVIRGSVEGREKYCRIPIRQKRKTDKEIEIAMEILKQIEVAEVEDEAGVTVECKTEIQMGIETAISVMQELKQYRQIGTVEKCREVRERQQAMKVTDIHVDEYFCPACGSENNCDQGRVGDKYCPKCGQAIYQGEAAAGGMV